MYAAKQNLKHQQLIRDVTRYRIDVCVIQETKVLQLSNTSLDNHRVIFFKTKSSHFVMVSLSLQNWKTMFTGIGMCQTEHWIELVFYKSSYLTSKSAHANQKKHHQNSRTV